MANEWHQICNTDDNAVASALGLLQASAEGYGRLETIPLLRKMRPGEFPKTKKFCLRLFSYVGEEENLEDPLVSAFFFLRRRRKMGPPDPRGLWAYCLSVGAKKEADGGLDKDELKTVLNEVCLIMQSIDRGTELQVMHAQDGPPFYDDNHNLRDAFNELRDAADPPKLIDHPTRPTIDVNRPWSYSQGEETLTWLKIIPRH